MLLNLAIKTLVVVFDKICDAGKICVVRFQRSEKLFFFFREFRFGNDFAVYGLDAAVLRNGFPCLKRLLPDYGFFKRSASKFYFLALIYHTSKKLERSDDFAVCGNKLTSYQ
jgi:hypothetical protein